MSDKVTDKASVNSAELSSDGSANGVCDLSKIYTDKANEIKSLLNGFSQQDVQNILDIFNRLLPDNLILSSPPK